VLAYVVATVVGVALFSPMERLFEQWDAERLRWVIGLRTPSEDAPRPTARTAAPSG